MSERKFYQKITDIDATALDYDSSARTTRLFFAEVQNKLHWAIHRHTAAELIMERADAEKPHMGLTSGSSIQMERSKSTTCPLQKTIFPEESEALERIVTMYLDYAEYQAGRHIPMTMQDWSQRLNRFLEFNEHEDPPRYRSGDP
ncbi:MAG: RhuM family protein [Oscillospiraceae bacterium]